MTRRAWTKLGANDGGGHGPAGLADTRRVDRTRQRSGHRSSSLARPGSASPARRLRSYRTLRNTADRRVEGRKWPGLLLGSTSLASSRPGRTVAPFSTPQGADRPVWPVHPNSSELWHCTACPGTGSHLGSPLRSGRPVLTLGVSGRRGVSGLCPCRSLTERGAARTQTNTTRLRLSTVCANVVGAGTRRGWAAIGAANRAGSDSTSSELVGRLARAVALPTPQAQLRPSRRPGELAALGGFWLVDLNGPPSQSGPDVNTAGGGRLCAAWVNFTCEPRRMPTNGYLPNVLGVDSRGPV
jgi:hypothetical protein